MIRLLAALIVKNEASVIARTIESLAGKVDGLVLVDTGSTDGTLDVALDACIDHRIGLSHYVRPWVNYGHNRSELLEFAREWSGGEGHTVVLDADETLCGVLPDVPLTAGGYNIVRLLAGDFEVGGVRFFSNAVPWFYQGALHEYPTVSWIDETTVDRLESLWIENHNDGAQGAQAVEAVRARYRRDAEHFRARLEADPTDTRSAYYLAQSLHDAGCQQEAAQAYERRIGMAGGFQDEIQISLLQLARYASGYGASQEQVRLAYERAIAFAPSRLCGHVELAAWHNHRGEFEAAEVAAANACAITRPTGTFLTRRSYREWRRYSELHRAQMALGHDATMAASKVVASSAPRHVKLYAAQSLNQELA